MTEPEQKPKKKKISVWLIMTILIIVGVAGILIYLFTNFFSSVPFSPTFQQCISDKQFTVFTISTCPHCTNMKELLEPYDNIYWIDCEESEDICRALDVQFVPAYGIVKNETMEIIFRGEVTVEILEQEICGGVE